MTGDQNQIRAQLQTKLRRLARSRSEDFQRMLLRFAWERFLFRLGESSAREAYVLKGGALFFLWTEEPYRTTRNLDFTGYGRPEELRESLLEIFEAVGDDGLFFDGQSLRIEPIAATPGYGGLRARFEVYLGKAKVTLQLDVGYGDAVEAEDAFYPVLLDHAAPKIRVYSKPAFVAEKFEILVRLGVVTSRMKDFFDLMVLSRDFEFDGSLLVKATENTFRRRHTPLGESIPTTMTPDYYTREDTRAYWATFLVKNQVEDNETREFSRVGQTLQDFLLPILPGSATARGKHWPAGGPWT